ncbi:HD-like signal output (HDOD) protein/GAF domain-containing protein [Oxalobacteraceae bacterium GrIS 1.18]
MPETLLKLMEQCQSEVVGMAVLLRLVEQDVAVTARILSIANSSAYSRGGQAATLELAIKTIGTEMIKIIVINESVSQVFDKMSKSQDVDLSAFWLHSLKAGLAARIVAQKIAYSNPDEAYLAGILHDVGRLAMLAVMPREYGVNFQAADNDDLCAIEERSMQITHPEAGSWLVGQWKLDSFIADSVLYHHEAAARLQDSHPLIRITHLAHNLASSDVSDQELEKSGALCALRMADLREIRDQIGREVQQAAKHLNLDLSARASTPKAATAVESPAQQKMMVQLHDMMLSSTLERSFAQQGGETDLLETVTRAARILFNFDCAVLLVTNPTGDALVGSRSGEHRQRLADFVLPLNMENSSIAHAALTRQIGFTPAVTPTMHVVEQQLLRLFATEHLACVPLHVEGTCLGMLLGGFKSWRMAELQGRTKFLTAFCNQAASALNTRTHQTVETAQQVDKLAREYRDVSRKMAHEVNNPLSIIKNYLGILDRKLSGSQSNTGELAILNEEIDRVVKIIDDFAQASPVQQSGKTDLAAVVADVVQLFRKTGFASPLLRLDNRMTEQHVEVNAAADSLKQIFVNLIKNSIEAIPGAGLIEIGSNGIVNRDGIVYVSLWLKDTGPGIPPEMMSKLFSPIQSSKGQGHSGLGLHIVHDMVKKMQGLITCQTSMLGTTFEILLPSAHHAESVVAN